MIKLSFCQIDSPHWRVILTKGQFDHLYTFGTMPILIFNPVYLFMRHPLGSNIIKAKHCSKLSSVMPLSARDTDLKLIGHLTDYYFSPTVWVHGCWAYTQKKSITLIVIDTRTTYFVNLILQILDFLLKPGLWAFGRGDMSTLSFGSHLSQPEGADYAHPILVSTPSSESHRRAWGVL